MQYILITNVVVSMNYYVLRRETHFQIVELFTKTVLEKIFLKCFYFKLVLNKYN